MKIDLNKDFEQEYVESVFMGLSRRQRNFFIAGLCIGCCVSAALYLNFDLPVVVCIYSGLPAIVATAALGLGRYQGYYINELLMEWLFYEDTSNLLVAMGERIGAERCFTMKRMPEGTGKRKGIRSKKTGRKKTSRKVKRSKEDKRYGGF